jgi:hypothetical protein
MLQYEITAIYSIINVDKFRGNQYKLQINFVKYYKWYLAVANCLT